MRSKRISVDMAVRRESGRRHLNSGTRKGIDYVVLTVYGTHKIDVWLSPAEARKLAEYINRSEDK